MFSEIGKHHRYCKGSNGGSKEASVRNCGLKRRWMVAYCAAVLAVSTTCRGIELKHLRQRAESIGSNQPDHFVFLACERNKFDPNTPQKTWRTAWRSLVKETARRAGNQVAKLAEQDGKDAEEARKRAAEPFRGLRFHDLRHQAITEMAEAGASDARSWLWPVIWIAP